MAGLFTGTPQTATSYVTSTSETPKWMQDAIFNQINMATNVANTPYQPYTGAKVAGLTPYQEAAYQGAAESQGSWMPAMNQAMVGTGNLTGTTAATTAAAPYLQKAGQTSVADVNSYMNPFNQNVMDVIAKQGARNLSENLLPAVSDSFIKAGQFGGTRMGEFGSRAVRDTQEAILNQQAQLAQQGYTQALGASSADLSRMAGLGSTAGGLAQTDVSQQLAAQQQLGGLTQASQSMNAADLARLESAGAAYQTQQQRELDSAYQDYQNELLYPKQQLDWLSTQVRGMAPITPQVQTNATSGTSQTGLSPLSQLASAGMAAAGLSKAFG